MLTKYLYVSPTYPALSQAEQESLFDISFDKVIIEDKSNKNQPHRTWIKMQSILKDGDMLAIPTLALFSSDISIINRYLKKLLDRGVTIRIGAPEILISPANFDPVFRLVKAYDTQVRLRISHNIKAALASSGKVGRPQQLTLEQLPDLRNMMADPNLNMKDIMKKYGVARSTIYKFMRKEKSN